MRKKKAKRMAAPPAHISIIPFTSENRIQQVAATKANGINRKSSARRLKKHEKEGKKERKKRRKEK